MGTRLFVGNVPHSTTDQELGDFVSNAGFDVQSAEVIRDRMTGAPRGFGFVQLADGSDIQSAIAALHGKRVEGRPLTVSEARPPRTASRAPGSGIEYDRVRQLRSY